MILTGLWVKTSLSSNFPESCNWFTNPSTLIAPALILLQCSSIAPGPYFYFVTLFAVAIFTTSKPRDLVYQCERVAKTPVRGLLFKGMARIALRMTQVSNEAPVRIGMTRANAWQRNVLR